MGVLARTERSLSLGLSILLVFTIGPGATTCMAYQSTEPSPAGSTAPSYPGQGVPATAQELQSLVAPIALYPILIDDERLDVVYEKNLGKDTADVAESLTEFNPDNTWTALH